MKRIFIPALFVGMMVVIALSRVGSTSDPNATYPQALVTPKNMTVVGQCCGETAEEFDGQR